MNAKETRRSYEVVVLLYPLERKSPLMSRDAFFTIITASYNCGHSLASALESVKNQTCRDVEHIVIDGGSADETREVLKHYETQYHLHWISEPDRGLADAMNKGVHVARGCYVIFIHADDALIEPTILDSVSTHIRSERHDICSFPVIRERPSSSSFPYRPIRVPGWYHFKHTIPHQGAFVHRRLFERIGGFREEFSIAMDYDFFYRAIAAKASIRFFSQPVSRMGGCGVSSNSLFLLKRLREEHLVQDLNEANRFWRAAQKAFRSLYVPYKTYRLRQQLKGPQA
jgi:glycosyltransferase involved in cell wall biosynthesis